MTDRRLPRAIVVAFLTVGLTLAPGLARAVEPAAAILFQEGRRLLLAGHFTEACARFRQSYAVEASSGTLLNLALCNEKLGKPATALAQYRDTVELAHRQGREDRAAAALQNAEALELTVPRLILVATKPPPGLKTSIDNGTPREDGLGMAVPLDPGPHEIAMSAPGRQAQVLDIELGGQERRTLELPELELERPARRAPAAFGLEDAPVSERPRMSPRSKADLYAAAGGGVFFLAGGVIWSVALAKFASAEDACNTFPGCSPAERDGRASTIKQLEVAAFATWVSAGALLAGSAIHHFWRGRGGAPAVGVAPTPGSAALSVSGVF